MERGRKGREGERRKVEKKGLKREPERIREQAVQSSVCTLIRSLLCIYFMMKTKGLADLTET